MSELWSLTRRDGPVIINVPHAGVLLPGDLRLRLTATALQVPDTDWHVEKLYASLSGDATLMWARYSRIVVDLNRDPAGTVLYPGASNTEACPTSTFHDEPIYLQGRVPDSAEIVSRVQQYWQPYHAQLAIEIERIRQRHGYCILLDGHSIVSVAPRFFEGRLPDLNLGTADVTSCESSLAADAFRTLSRATGFSAVHNGRFKGGFITRHFGQPQNNVHALQLEMAQSCYMDEQDPQKFDPERAAPLNKVLQSLLATLEAWRPPLGEPGKT